MKTRVNLYLAEFRPVIDPLPLPIVLASWVIAIVFVVIFRNSVVGDYDQIKLEGESLSAEFKQYTAMVSELEQAQQSRKQDQALIDELTELESELRAKQILLAELVDREKFKNNGYSMLMADLAELNVSSLWLNQIRVDEANVYVRGNALESEAVPRWVNGLKESEFFLGKKFAGVKLFREDNDELAFILSTDRIEEDVKAQRAKMSTSTLVEEAN